MFRLNPKGAAAVEFAIVLPLLMLLICGTIEFGVLLYNKQVVTNASREAVRAGITGVGDATIVSIAATYCNERLIGLKNGYTPDQFTVQITPPDAHNDMTVDVSLAIDMLFAHIIGIDQTIISGQTVMRMEPT